MEEPKVGRPAGCSCGTCTNCKRREKYRQKQIAERKLLPAASAPLPATPDQGAPSNSADAGDVLHATLENVPAPEFLGAVEEDFAWDSLAPAPPDPEAEEARAETDAFEEKVRQAGAVHVAIGVGCAGYVMAMIKVCEDNGMQVPNLDLLPPDMLKAGLAKIVAESGTRLAVKYLPDDLERPEYADELIVAGAVGGSTFAAYYARKSNEGGPAEPVDDDQGGADELHADAIDADSDEKPASVAPIGRGRMPWDK